MLPPTIFLFIPAALLLLLMPGPSVIFISTKAISSGRKEGLKSVIGVELGGLTHAVFAAAGLSLILLESSFAFDVVKYLGAAYLFYLGIKALLSKKNNHAEPNPLLNKNNRSSSFLNGYLVDLLNPKVALFFYAFLPQFVVAGYGAFSTQMLLFGLMFAAIGFCTDSLYAILSSTAKEYVVGKVSRFTGKLKYITAATYIALGLVAATSNIKART